jgi:hypothetical protein
MHVQAVLRAGLTAASSIRVPDPYSLARTKIYERHLTTLAS